jgi:dTDP-4-dehydrorhamnose 3,5-epimerase
MRWTGTAVQDVWLLDLEPVEDARGGFARAFDAAEVAGRGLDGRVAQVNTSWNAVAGTLRGLHLQVDPPEAKVLRCVRGAVFDVAVDLREDSPTHLRWTGVELVAEQRRAVYVPPGVAHGYLALTDGAEVLYSASAPYVPGQERGVRWDDPAIGIAWPREVTVVSDKDRSWPLLAPS